MSITNSTPEGSSIFWRGDESCHAVVRQGATAADHVFFFRPGPCRLTILGSICQWDDNKFLCSIVIISANPKIYEHRF